MKTLLIPAEKITQSILFIRGQKVMLDRDLAALYGVETRALIQSVQRNRKRFPSDFMFQMTQKDARNLRSQFVISSEGHGGRRYLPYVFTEQGVVARASPFMLIFEGSDRSCRARQAYHAR